ncbi:K(+)-transporting ATPase subunit F [Streptomyces sp. NPDC088246]
MRRGRSAPSLRNRLLSPSENIIGLIVAVSLLGYLVLAIKFPDRF